MTITTRKTVKLLPSQYQVALSNKREIMYSGGYGSGKSLIGSWMALREASIPNNRVLVIRKTQTSLRKSTMLTLQSILPEGSYQFNKTEAIIKFHNGSEIFLMGMDDPERIKSTEFGGCFIDEASEFNEEEYLVIKYRMRHKAGTRRIYIATNPSNQNHFLYKRFYMDSFKNPIPLKNRMALSKNRMAITASSLENPFLPKDYVEELNLLEGARKDRCVNGLWVNLDNMIFDAFDRNLHVFPFEDSLMEVERKQFEDIVIGIDYGYTHPTGMVVVGLHGSKMKVIEEFYKSRLLIRDIVDQVKEFGKKYPMATYVYDPSAAGLGAELENLDLHVLPANNDVKQGIDRIRNRLKFIDDTPELMVGSNCINLIKEMENYTYVSGTEKPVKIGDDLCFIGGTKILTYQGYKNIEDVKINDSVYDGKTYNKISNSILRYSDVVMYRINNRFLVCTSNHPIFVNDVKIPIGELCRLYKDKHQKELLKKLNLTEDSIDDIYITVATNTLPVAQTELTELTKYQGVCIGTYGKNTMVKFLKDMMFTIKTSTIQIMIVTIMNWLKVKNISRSMVKSFIKTILSSLKNKLTETKTNVDYGMVQRKKETTSAPITASPIGVGGLEKIILRLYAQYVEILSKKTGIQKPLPVQESVQEKLEVVNCTGVIGNLPVYNLTVENSHRYTANNILVSNCDPLRYVTNYVDDIKGSYIFPQFIEIEEVEEPVDLFDDNALGRNY